MPVATADDFIDQPEKPQAPTRQRTKSTSIGLLSGMAERDAALRVTGNYHQHTLGDNQPSASYLPRDSPILNLSPNLSPESHVSSSSPVFELLDSNQRRTVEGQCLNCMNCNWWHIIKMTNNIII